MSGPVKKGWCPGALRPMASGDGLLVRVRPRAGAFTGAQLAGIADLAARHGNRSIDLTRRANLQLRGVTEVGLGPVQDGLLALGLLDASPEAEAVRNVLVTPFVHGAAGSAIVRLAAELEALLAATPEFWALPGKVLLAVDDARGTLADAGADVMLRVADDGATAVLVSGDALVALPVAQAVAAVAEQLRAILVGDLRRQQCRGEACLALGAPDSASQPWHEGRGKPRPYIFGTVPPDHAPGKHCQTGHKAQDDSGAWPLQIAAAFGRVDATALTAVADAIGPEEQARPTPWRGMVLPAGTPLAILTAAGWIKDLADPLLRVDACPGAPACASAHRATRDVARAIAPRLAALGLDSAHVSGCAKGCARSRAADMVLVATSDGWSLVRNGRADDQPLRLIPPLDLERTGAFWEDISMLAFDKQPTLEGRTVSLRPLAASDLEALYTVASDPEIWTLHPDRHRHQRPVFEKLFAESLASGGAMIVVDRASGAVIGSSRYHLHAINADPDGTRAEIGWSYLARSHWGGTTNAEVKALLLAHAFRFTDTVCFRVAEANARSRRAMEKIGGTLTDAREDMLMAGVPVAHVVYQIGQQDFYASPLAALLPEPVPATTSPA